MNLLKPVWQNLQLTWKCLVSRLKGSGCLQLKIRRGVHWNYDFKCFYFGPHWVFVCFSWAKLSSHCFFLCFFRVYFKSWHPSHLSPFIILAEIGCDFNTSLSQSRTIGFITVLEEKKELHLNSTNQSGVIT